MLGAQEGAVQIDVDDLLPVLVLLLIQSGTAAADACIVDHGGQLAEFGLDLVDGLDPLVFVGHVQGGEHDLVMVLVHEFPGCVALLDVGQGHLGSLPYEALSHTQSDSAGSAGDDGNLAIETISHTTLL